MCYLFMEIRLLRVKNYEYIKVTVAELDLKDRMQVLVSSSCVFKSNWFDLFNFLNSFLVNTFVF